MTEKMHHAFLQIMDTVAEIQERHDAVRELERKLLDLQQVLMIYFLQNLPSQSSIVYFLFILTGKINVFSANTWCYHQVESPLSMSSWHRHNKGKIFILLDILFWKSQVFLDMAVLVDAQGELLDDIETQVVPASCKIAPIKKMSRSFHSTRTVFILVHVGTGSPFLLLSSGCCSALFHLRSQAQWTMFKAGTQPSRRQGSCRKTQGSGPA